MGFFIFLHFTLITAIICFVLLQRSAESSVLVSTTHFAPGEANNLLIKITRILVIIFMLNCLFISYMKYGSSNNEAKNDNIKTEKTTSVPTE